MKITIIGGERDGEVVEMSDYRPTLRMCSKDTPHETHDYLVYPFGNRFIVVQEEFCDDRNLIYDKLIDGYNPKAKE